MLAIHISIKTSSFKAHQSRNSVMPKQAALPMSRRLGILFASYAMSRDEFERWVSTHHVAIEAVRYAFVEHDSKRLNFAEPELAYATEMAS